MEHTSVLVVAGPAELLAWANALEARGFEVVRAATRGEALRVVRHQPLSAVLASVRLAWDGGLRLCRELKRDPALRELPVVLVGLAPLTPAERLRLRGAPDDCLAAGARAEEVAAAVEAAVQRGARPIPEPTPQQARALKLSRIGTLLMVFGVMLSLPRPGAAGAQHADPRAWFLMLVPLGGLVSDYATGRADGRARRLSWQGWAALGLGIALALSIVLFPGFYRGPPSR